jgi:hypothetical protein
MTSYTKIGAPILNLLVFSIAAVVGAGFVLAEQPPASFESALFNGENLDGWHVTSCQAGVENGALVLQSGDGFVRTDHHYRDFILELDWKARQDQDWDSGIYFRAALPAEGRAWPERYQCNLRQGQEGNVLGIPAAQSTGLVKPGEWNHFRLTVTGDRAELEINGQPAWKADGLDPVWGYIGFQAEVPLGGVFEFKNIRLTELGFESLFNGSDLSGWEGAEDDAARCWRVENGELVCTGEPGPWLRSQRQYGDFNLRLEYKVKAGGNSGVYVRVPKDGAHRGRELAGGGDCGTEVQILDDADPRYKDLAPYQFCGSVYAIAPAKEHVSRPAGEWNSLEIDCRGAAYRIFHNGTLIVDATETEFPELKDRLLAGYLGLQNHSEHVWFRNLRIGPAQE